MNWIVVFLGGGIGACLRYGIGLFAARFSLNWPLGTLLSNLLASLFIGLLAFHFFPKEISSTSKSWLFLATGICGGLSTFSTFSLESVQLWQHQLYSWFFFTVFVQVIACIAIVALLAKVSTVS